MAGRVYAVASGKGGVGKTVTAINLAVGFRLRGRPIAVVDADLETPNVADLLGVDAAPTVHDVLAGEAAPADAVHELADDFAVVPGDGSIEAFATADPDRLEAALEAATRVASHVVVDTGAGLSRDRLLPLGLGDEVLLVTTPTPAALGDTRKVASLASVLGVPIRGAVVTHAVDALDADDVADRLGVPVLAAVPRDPAVPESGRAGEPLESHDPESDAAAAYRRLAARLAGDER